MKKIILFCLIAMFVAPAAAMAVETFTAEEIKKDTEMISTLSNNVSLIVESGGDAYAAASGHASGSKVYASTSGDTKIYQDSITTLPTLSSSDTAQFSDGSGSWEPM